MGGQVSNLVINILEMMAAHAQYIYTTGCNRASFAAVLSLHLQALRSTEHSPPLKQFLEHITCHSVGSTGYGLPLRRGPGRPQLQVES